MRAWPPTALQPEIESVERMFAHSERLALPTITAPAARSRATRGASRPVTLSASARLPAVVGSGPDGLDIVLDQDRHAEQRPARAADAVERPRLVERGRIDRDHRVEPRIELLDLGERGLGALFGGHGRSRLLGEGGGGGQREGRAEEEVPDHGRETCLTFRVRLVLAVGLRPLDRLHDQRSAISRSPQPFSFAHLPGSRSL